MMSSRDNFRFLICKSIFEAAPAKACILSWQGEQEAQEVAARLEEMMAGLIKVAALPLQFKLFEYIVEDVKRSTSVIDASMEFERSP